MFIIHLSILSCFSYVWLFVNLRTIAHQAPLSTGFSRQEYWSGLPFPSLGDLPNPEMAPRPPTLQPSSLLYEPLGKFFHIFFSQEIYCLTEEGSANMTASPSRFQAHIKLYFWKFKCSFPFLLFFFYLSYSRRNIHHFLSRVGNIYSLHFYNLFIGYILKKKTMQHYNLRMRM